MASETPWSFTMLPIPRKESGNNNTLCVAISLHGHQKLVGSGALNLYVTFLHFTKQARNMLESYAIVKSSRMCITVIITICPNIKRNCKNKVSGIIKTKFAQ